MVRVILTPTSRLWLPAFAKTMTKTFAKFDGAPTASGLADARDPVGDRLDGNRHMEGIGVNKRGAAP
jgi:hypothetical protein